MFDHVKEQGERFGNLLVEALAKRQETGSIAGFLDMVQFVAAFNPRGGTASDLIEGVRKLDWKHIRENGFNDEQTFEQAGKAFATAVSGEVSKRNGMKPDMAEKLSQSVASFLIKAVASRFPEEYAMERAMKAAAGIPTPEVAQQENLGSAPDLAAAGVQAGTQQGTMTSPPPSTSSQSPSQHQRG